MVSRRMTPLWTNHHMAWARPDAPQGALQRQGFWNRDWLTLTELLEAVAALERI